MAGKATRTLLVCVVLLVIGSIVRTLKEVRTMPTHFPQQQQQQQHHGSDVRNSLPLVINSTHTVAQNPKFHIPNGSPDIIFFTHVAKTGGTTIRDYLNSLDRVVYTRISSPKDVTPKFAVMSKFLHAPRGGKHKTLFVEVHKHRQDIHIGSKHFSEHLRKLGKEAAIQNKTIFSLTVVREPISFYQSYFRFFHRAGCRFQWCEQVRFSNLSEENLLLVAKYNPQISILVGDTRLENYDDFLQESMGMYDWIGTTDQLSYNTMPMLSAIMTNGTANRTFRSHNVAAADKKVLVRNETVLEILKSRSTYDRRFYDWVAQSYVLPQES